MLYVIVADMRTIGQRLTHALQIRKLGPNEVDRRAGLVSEKTDRGSGYTSRLSRDKRKSPDAEIVRRIAKVLKVRFEWLMFGTGAMEGDDEEGLAAELRASTAGGTPRTIANEPLEVAIAYWRHKVSDEAIRRVRAKAPALDMTPDQLGDLLIEEQQAINRELAERAKANRERGNPPPPVVHEAPVKKRKAV